MRDYLSFVLNGEPQTLRDVDPATTLLQHLRKTARLTGTKEGCAEGDCGACTVVIADLANAGLTYRALNACILLLPMLEGRSVTTVEHVDDGNGDLHPVQRALVDNHGSQCGFCTPGFVMSLYAAYLSGQDLGVAAVNDLLAGNLCRCTGYGPILRAAQDMYALPHPAGAMARRGRELAQLKAITHGQTIDLQNSGRRFLSPTSLAELARLYEDHPHANIVAGATDLGLWVTKLQRELGTVISIGRVRELQLVHVAGSTLRIGAAVTWSDLMEVLSRHYPDFGELLRRFASTQVRNAATIGGNIANASPIGDAPPALIALGAKLTLRKGTATRTLPLESYFLAHGRQDRQPGEFVQAIEVPLLDAPERLKCYKLSKRFDQDISAVCGCFNIDVRGGIVAAARICYGGMATTPKRAANVEAALTGKAWSLATVTAALPAYDCDYTPLSDARASATYRRRAAKNLLLKYFHETKVPLSRTRLVGRQAAFGS
jgi:xanthine dehydrogenase small subunit